MNELLLLLAVFHLWHALTPACDGRVAFAPRRGGLRARRDEAPGDQRGRTWLHLWPSAPTFVCQVRPLRLEGDALAPRFADARARAARFPATALAALAANGRDVRSGRALVVRCVTARQARRTVEALRQLSRLDAGARVRRLADLARSSLDSEAFARSRARAALPLRALELCCDTALLLVASLPLLAAFIHEDVVLLGALPALGVVHVGGVTALFLAHRKVAPHDRAGRLQEIFSAAAFPPSLWTSPALIRSELAAPYHPAALAHALLARPAFVDVLRGELALLERRAADERARGDPDPNELALLGLEHGALLDFAAARGVEAGECAAPRARRDPEAASHCPVCLADYRPGFAWCPDCRVPTLAYDDRPAIGSAGAAGSDARAAAGP